MNRSKDLVKYFLFGVIGMVLSLGVFNCQPALAEDEEHENDAGALFTALPQSKLSLSDGVRQATKGTEVPISAKFELDDNGKLSLSVYTAEKGLAIDAQKNVLEELAGSPESQTWNPQTEVFTDEEHLGRAGNQLAIMAKSKFSLLDIIQKVEKENVGTVFAATPEKEGGIPVIEIKIVKAGKVTEQHFDIASGNELKMD